MNFNATLIGQIIAFAIFVWFTMKYVWPYLLKMMHERETRIADGLAAAEKGQQTLEEAEQRLADMVNEGKQQAGEIISQAQRRGDEIIEAAKDEARVEGERLKTAARSEIEQERMQAREQLKEEVAMLALAGAEQILMREVDKKAHNELLAKLSAEL